MMNHCDYSVIFLDGKNADEIFEMRIFTSMENAKSFCKGFRHTLNRNFELVDADINIFEHRGSRFVFQWINFAAIHGFDRIPLLSIAGKNSYQPYNVSANNHERNFEKDELYDKMRRKIKERNAALRWTDYY